VNETSIWLTDFSKNSRYKTFRKFFQWEPKSSKRTDRHDEVNICSSFSQDFTNTPKNKYSQHTANNFMTLAINSDYFPKQH